MSRELLASSNDFNRMKNEGCYICNKNLVFYEKNENAYCPNCNTKYYCVSEKVLLGLSKSNFNFEILTPVSVLDNIDYYDDRITKVNSKARVRILKSKR